MRTYAKRQPATTATYLERVNLAIDHIVTRLHEPLRLRDIARIAMLSPFHFHRVFQAIVGETPADFVKRLRLEKALGAMASPRPRPLTSIALACGFSSSSDFSRCFKQRFGVSPSAFDIKAWRKTHAGELNAHVEQSTRHLKKGSSAPPANGSSHYVKRLPGRDNPDEFKVNVRDLPFRTVSYIRVARPYRGDAVFKATQRLVAWADRHGLAGGQWLGYQRENPEFTSLDNCQYYTAIEMPQGTRTNGRALASQPREVRGRGEIGRFTFPPMTVAQVEIRGGIELELRALYWLYGTWLPRSGYVPDDQPGFEAWIGRPFAHGVEHFELYVQLPIRRP